MPKEQEEKELEGLSKVKVEAIANIFFDEFTLYMPMQNDFNEKILKKISLEAAKKIVEII